MQVIEKEVLAIDEYDRIAEEGWHKFYYEDYVYRISRLKNRSDTQREMKKLEDLGQAASREWGKRGVKNLCGSIDFHPFFKLSLMRSMVKFTEDLYYRGDIVEKALRRMTDDMIPPLVETCKKTGLKVAAFVEERASAFYYPLKVFERFWWPYTEKIVDALFSEGIVLVMHLDTNWDKNVPYFKRLPKGSVVLELDSMTDIFQAKKVLEGHQAFHGDVSPSLQSIGTPEDIADYCKRLIDEVGYDGGLVLGVGCEVAPDCTRDNFRAMLETARTYEFSRA
jgi:uroporphyrinogen-III decarboxylase